MHTEEVYLIIAGIRLRIVFHPVKEKHWARDFMHLSIDVVYASYIGIKQKKFDYTLEISLAAEAPHIILDTKTQTSYIELSVHKKKQKILKTFYHIGLFPLNLLLLRIIDEVLSTSHGFLFHASSVVHQQKAYLFLADSGGGKSTMARIAGERIQLVSDDTVGIRMQESDYRLYAVPESYELSLGKKNKNTHQSGHRIDKIFILRKSDNWNIDKIASQEIKKKYLMKQLLTQAEHYRHSAQTMNDFIDQNKERVFYLDFPLNPTEKEFFQCVEDYERKS